MRNFAIGLLILVTITPLGLLATSDTFGEWSNKEVKEKLGFVPSGLEQLSSLWAAPLSDYTLPREGSQHNAAGTYILSAAIGAVVCVGLLYLMGKRIAKE